MDETAKLSHICPQQNNDQTESTDSTAHDIFLVGKYENNEECLRIVQLDPERCAVTSVGEIPYFKWPSVEFCGGTIFCLGDDNCSGRVHAFDLLKRTAWTPTQLVEPVRATASAASGHEFIVSGGQNKRFQVVSTCSVYAPATNRWTSLRQLRQARRSHRMCWLPDGRVFSIGGYDYHAQYSLSSVEMLKRAWIPAHRDEASAEWQNVAPMKTVRYSFGCCVVEGRIVVAGGWTPDGNSLSVESFEPPTATNIGQWTSLTDLTYAVSQCFLVKLTDGLVLMDWNNGRMQLGRRKAQVASFNWTWETRSTLKPFTWCWGMVSWPSTAVSTQR